MIPLAVESRLAALDAWLDDALTDLELTGNEDVDLATFVNLLFEDLRTLAALEWAGPNQSEWGN